MPRISTDNYDTVASWNGSQDLFIVEQPDGTKVATPALLKQYVLDGVTETSEQYAESSTARNVAAKTVTLAGFKLETGARISVRFTDTGSSNPASGHITLNVNGTGAKEIVDGHTNMTILGNTSGGLFCNNIVNDFIYDGTYWVYMNRDNNTTYSNKAAASGGTTTSLCTTGEKYTWNNKQAALTFDNVPTQNSNNPVKSGGIFSTMAVPKYDSANRREYYEGGAAFDGNIDSSPTAGSNNAVSSGGTFTALAGKIDSILSANSSALNVDDTFQIPSAMLNRKILIISANRAAWTGSVTVATDQIKYGDCGNGVKIVTGDRSNPTVDKYIILTISSTGLITVKYINNWSAPYLFLFAL